MYAVVSCSGAVRRRLSANRVRIRPWRIRDGPSPVAFVTHAAAAIHAGITDTIAPGTEARGRGSHGVMPREASPAGAVTALHACRRWRHEFEQPNITPIAPRIPATRSRSTSPERPGAARRRVNPHRCSLVALNGAPPHDVRDGRAGHRELSSALTRGSGTKADVRAALSLQLSARVTGPSVHVVVASLLAHAGRCRRVT